jgi:N-acetylglutamate synthase-like GNAT family acetyltransferase
LIRIAKPADLDAVGSLLAASYSSLLATHYDDDLLGRALPHITKAKPDLLACGTYYVAETEPGKIVGCGGWTSANPGSGEIAEREAHIRHFAIHPHWIRRGIATGLLVRCFNDAQSFGILKLQCVSTLNAERFYQASGFKRVGPIDVPICPDLTFPCILMGREMH